MKIGVVGTGYVGLVAATCFAEAGHAIIATDSNSKKLELLSQGCVPFFEPGLEDLFTRVHDRLTFTNEISSVVDACEVIFVAVGTPELPDGSADLGPTFRVLESICKAAKTPRYVVLKSTVPIGTAERATRYCREQAQTSIEIVSNPEFLRQGAALKDFLQPDRIVIGCSSTRAKELMDDLYRPFLKSNQQLIVMDNVSAEMVKYAANSFLALKISYINELALLADRVGADIEDVRAGFSSDNRINPAFFNPGIGYGGSCFPKDVRALIYTAREQGMELKLLQAADDVNERQKSVLIDRLYKRFGNLTGVKVGVWGLAFKPQTDDVRRAPSIKIIEDLVRDGARVAAYDPVAADNAKSSCLAQFENASSPLAAAQGADALLIVTEWNEFKTVDLEQLRSAMKQPIVFDGRNVLDAAKVTKHGFEYYGIGRAAAALGKLKPKQNY